MRGPRLRSRETVATGRRFGGGSRVGSALLISRVVGAGAVSDWDEPHSAAQTYLDAAPVGIGVRPYWGAPVGTRVWDRPGGDGSGQRVVVIDRGWCLDHPNLPDTITELDPGQAISDRDAKDHGTAMLGIIAAADKGVGIVGITPNLASVVVASCEPDPAISPITTPAAVERALTRAIDYLAANPPYVGDILALPIQWEAVTIHDRTWRGLPIEIEPSCFAAIKRATALGIVVVEAAGNGGHDLDHFTDPAGRRTLWRDAANPDFDDSGAIMVAGAVPITGADNQLTYRRSTNYGHRVDCFAHGRRVETCRLGGRYGSASGSSAAAAIIAGAAASLLALHKNGSTGPNATFGPSTLRNQLMTGGTSTQFELNQHLGVMPDLARPNPDQGQVETLN